MTAILIFGAVLLLAGVGRFTSWLRHQDTSASRWMSTVRAGADLAAWASGGSLCVVIAVSAPESGALLWVAPLACSCLGAATAAFAASHLLRSLHHGGLTSLRRHLRARMGIRLRSAASSVRRLWSVIAPTGFSEVQFGLAALERLFRPLTFVRAYGMSFVLVPVLVALVFTRTMTQGSTLERAALGAFFGYNALAVVAYVTAAAILALVAMSVLAYSHVLAIQLSLAAAAKTIVSCTGYGTAAGLVTAALLPFMSHFLGGYAGKLESQMPLTPEILVELPAAFAVVGYVIGIAAAAVTLCRNADNLLLRRFIAPVILMLILVGLINAAFGPHEILRNMMASAPGVSASECTDASFLAHLSSPSWLFSAMDSCGAGESVLSNEVFLWVSGVFTGSLALLEFVRDVRRTASPTADGADHEPSATRETASSPLQE